jgi:aspartate carbamoyltransferase regulatory subunit
MNDPVLKAKQLQEKAIKRSQERIQAEKNEKIRQWQEIQQKAPEIALAMKVISEKMGKFTSVKIKFF